MHGKFLFACQAEIQRCIRASQRSRIGGRRYGAHCTVALTEALPLMVNVQVLALLPPLAHAPDQMASRPLLTLKVIALLVAKLAD